MQYWLMFSLAIFARMLRLIFICALFAAFFLPAVSTAQNRKASGVVYDVETKTRLARVQVVNLRTRALSYNNLKGEFSVLANPGDKLSFSTTNFKADTVTYSGQNVLLVYLKRTSITLPTVNIYDSLNNPKKKLEIIKREYSKIYGPVSDRDVLNIPPAGAGPAGLSIDALYNMISREGRNAKKLQKLIERDYREQVIDYRFNRSMVGTATGLKDDKLADFMQKYRPSYNFVVVASDYEMLSYIVGAYNRYIRNPNAYALPPLIGPGPKN